MEVEAAKRIWQRSADTGLRYTTMLSDGDSKALDAIVSMRPYGDVDIKKNASTTWQNVSSLDSSL